MTELSVKLEDTKVLDRLLKISRTQLIEKTINKGIKKSMYVVLWDVLRRVPVDTWKLKRSHEVFFWNLYGEIFTRVEYAEKVHQWIWQRSQPWLKNSMKNSKWRIEAIFWEKIDYLIKRM